jgi:hypothetical protein
MVYANQRLSLWRMQSERWQALYLDTPAGRVFRAIVGHQSGPEWQDFSDDQMRRRVSDIWARRLWDEDPTMYPHPDDDLDALNPPAPKRERDETPSDFMYRRAEELRNQSESQNVAQSAIRRRRFSNRSPRR